MKLKHGFLFGFALLFVAAIFIVTGCDDGSTPEMSVLTGSVSIIGGSTPPKARETLRADTSGLGGTGTLSYLWKRGTSADAVSDPISDANKSTYTLVAADVGRFLRVTVSRAGYSGSVTSSAVGPVGAADSGFVPVSDISGVPSYAKKETPLILTGSVMPENATNKTIVWTVTSAGDTGATINENTLNTTGTGTVTISATIANGATADTPFSKVFSIIVEDELPLFIPVSDITGVPPRATVGIPLTLIGTVTPGDATNKTIIWSVKNAGSTGASISGNTLHTTAAGSVTIRAAIANGTAQGQNYTQEFTITVASLDAGTGSAGLTITFAQISDAAPSITGPTLYRVSNNGPTTTTITVENPEQYESISWGVQDTTVSGAGASFTLDAANTAYNLIGEHFVTVKVMKNGVPYNKTVSFTVAYQMEEV